MSKSRWYSVVIDCNDIKREASFWEAVLDWKRIYEAADEIVLVNAEETEPGLVFVTVPEEKTTKNRLHIDLAPDDMEAEVERIVGLGATRVDIGQVDVPWVVLASPGGNELCVLTPR